MPVNLEPLSPAGLPPTISTSLPPSFAAGGSHLHDAEEVATLRATVAGLLEEIRRRPPCEPAGDDSGNRAALAAPGVSPVDNTAVASAMQQAEFIAMLAHELRNPLQSMAMASQLLASAAETDPAVFRSHGVLNRQINHMSRLLDDLLDASRAASGKIVLQLASVSLADVINAAVEAAQPAMQHRHQKLVVDAPDPAMAVTGDLVRLAQVFSNLLNNASQFSDAHTSIVFGFAVRGAMVDVSVSDNGAGIAPEFQACVFDLFTQGQRTLERAQGGLGLGLSLVRTIARLHGGNATVVSAGTGFGSTFTISLPLAPEAPLTVAPAPPRNAAARRILLIEDNVDANEILAMLLEMDGHQVTSSFDGIDGLRQALAGSFDIVLCDLGLPGLTGLEVIATLKGERKGNSPMAIATTGYSDDAQRDLARAAGFDHYLVKPLELPLLYEAIADHVR